MCILGIDPGLNITGYGLVEANLNFNPRILEAGVIKTTQKFSLSQKIGKIYQGVKKLVEEFHPDAIVLEELYSHYRHPKTAILMGHARGVISLVAEEKQIPLIGYSSTRVKKAICGRGNATKEQIQRMIQYLLGLEQTPQPKDVSDALALALAHAHIVETDCHRLRKASKSQNLYFFKK
ncbi:MAG: crossover junction endodeoxyribonuclease RuvC [Candidatus Omnitrophica bacterium]|nr:crossover junction endodeoxyribonuclease RuvC [Candidatus Omnitrophota bacterium]